MKYTFIDDRDAFLQLCSQLERCERICFDTEFVSEFTYRPDLCLLQVEYDGNLAIVDTHAVSDVTPFWQVLVAGDHITIVHAGREEYRFCQAATGQAPRRWFDVQLAAGMVGHEYPISYGKLVQKLVGASISKGETRTDWRRRPLTTGQLDYALLDVVHLPALQSRLLADLTRLGRAEWLEEETLSWQLTVDESDSRERWRRLSGVSKLPLSALPVARELWRWREEVAERRDSPPRRVLRDDLIVELARRGKADEKQIRAIRGLHRRDLDDHYADISAAIERGRCAPPEPKTRHPRRDHPEQINLLGQFLGTALASICRRQSIAASLVGTVQDVRDLTAYQLGLASGGETPALMTGWRAEIVGQRFRELLAGELALRIVDPHSEAPIAFEAVNGQTRTEPAADSDRTRS